MSAKFYAIFEALFHLINKLGPRYKELRKLSRLCGMIYWVVVLLFAFSFVQAEGTDSYPGAPLKQDNPFDDAFEQFKTFGSGDGDHFGRKRLYNTSIALTASMFSYLLPNSADTEGAVTDLVNQSVYGLFGVLAVSLIFAVPVLLTGVMYNPSTKRSFEGESENSWISSPIMKIENVKNIFNEEFRDEIGLDYEKCMQKTICEAHRSPKNKKFGLLALPFQMFFPAYNPTSSSGRARTSYQKAAADGSNTTRNCAKKYRCFFDILDLAAFLIDWYRLRNDPEYVPEESDSD